MPINPADTEGLADRTPDAAKVEADADLPRTLMGGTEAMRGKREQYLPRWPLEDTETYNSRLNSTFLFPGYTRAWQTLVGKVFAKPIQLVEPVSEDEILWQNIDLTGQNGDVFCQQVFGDTMHPGTGYILVDYPSVGAATTANLEVEQSAGLRPYWCYYPAESVLGWHSDRINGAEVLTMVRLAESTEEEAGWGIEQVERIRAFWLGTGGVEWARWRKQRDMRSGRDEWVIEDEPQPLWMSRTRSAQWQEIPLVPIPLRRTGFMTARPFLGELAYVNLEHWQSSSDQRANLHFDRVKIYEFIGYTDEEFKQVGGWGPGVRARTKAGSIVVHGGADSGSSQVGERDLNRLKEEMQVLSMEPLLPRTGGVTATARALDEARADASLLSAVANLQDALNLAWEYTALWLGRQRQEAATVMVNDKFGLTAENAEKGRLILDARNAGKISHRVFLERWIELGMLPEDLDIDEEMSGLQQEAPPTPRLGGAARPSSGVLARLAELAQGPPEPEGEGVQ